jgi:hypothetical protein
MVDLRDVEDPLRHDLSRFDDSGLLAYQRQLYKVIGRRDGRLDGTTWTADVDISANESVDCVDRSCL